MAPTSTQDLHSDDSRVLLSSLSNEEGRPLGVLGHVMRRRLVSFGSMAPDLDRGRHPEPCGGRPNDAGSRTAMGRERGRVRFRLGFGGRRGSRASGARRRWSRRYHEGILGGSVSHAFGWLERLRRGDEHEESGRMLASSSVTWTMLG